MAFKDRELIYIGTYPRVWDKPQKDGTTQRIEWDEINIEDRDKGRIFILKPFDREDFRKNILPKMDKLIGQRIDVAIHCELRGTRIKFGVVDILKYGSK